MKKIITLLIVFSFCSVEKVHFSPEKRFSISTRWKIFLWEAYYKKMWEDHLNRLTNILADQIDDSVKIGQIIHTGINGIEVQSIIQEQIKNYCPGGIILFKANIKSKEQLIHLIYSLQDISIKYCKIPLFFSIDQEGGRVERITDFVTEFPGAMAIGQTLNYEYAWLSGFITGYELSQLGIKMIFAPVADINNNPENPVINTRSFGSKKEEVSLMVQSYIRGINYTNALGFLKHFPGHGDTKIDSHLDLPIINKNKNQLYEFELVPFIDGIKSGAKGVMVAHILYPELDQNFPSTLSSNIISELLIKELNFNGLIITDAMEMKAISDRYTLEKSSLLSLNAGVHIILLTAQNENIKKIYNKIEESIKENQISKEKIEKSFRKQLYYKLDTGLWKIEELVENFKIPQEEIEIYQTILNFKNNLSENIYKEILNQEVDLSYKISYEAIRSLYKDFSILHLNQENAYFFIDSEEMKNEIKILLKNNNNFYIYNKKELLRLKNSFNKNDIIIIEIKNLNEWNEISKYNINYKLLIGLLTGNPFARVILKENQYIIVSFSPTKSSKKAMIDKIFKENILKAEIPYLPLLNE
jgi:beta-N-acetylhexosaminidase